MPPLRLVKSTVDPIKELGDDELMVLAQSDREDAFTELVVRYSVRLERFLSRYVGASDAGDLAQEVLATVWNKRARYKSNGRFSVFLYRCARNRAISHIRWRKVRRLFQEREAPAQAERSRTSSNPGLKRILDEERHAVLLSMVSALPANYRDAVVLRYAEGLDYESIARITGVQESTLRSRAHRGLAMLKARLERQREWKEVE